MNFSVGRSSWKVTAKSRAKLPVAGGSGCPWLLPQVLPKCTPKATSREGGCGLGPSSGGYARALLPRLGGHRDTTGQELNEAPTYQHLVNK